MGQKKSVINLIKSESIQGVKINGVDMLKVYKGVFQQDYSTLTSDSAYFHQAQNTFDAFGHVVIIQGDTMHIYSDKLNYNGNTKVAILTDNVKMVDKDAVLTTNYLTYNTATRIGTYTGGGKLVNKDNTLTSKNGYYFAYSRDSYFRYDVRLLTPDALILTDTLRYNSNSRIAYFYGPTNIYGKKKGKDNDTLYTEDGLYNTETEQAFFGKKNLYKQGTKTLHGDSMFYDRKQGYGRAVKNITFNDTEQKMTLKGNLGTYYKADERTVVTQNAYAIIVTEEKDTTKNDSLGAKTDGLKSLKDTTKSRLVKNIKTDNKVKSIKLADITKPANKPIVAKPIANVKTDSINNKLKKVIKPGTKGKLADTALLKKDSSLLVKDTSRIKHDSIYMTGDTLETKIYVYKDLKALQEKIRLANIKDTTKKAPSIVYKKPLKQLDALSPPAIPRDTTYRHRDYFGPPKPKVVPEKKPLKVAAIKKLTKQDSLKLKQDSIKLKKNLKPDSVYMTRKIELSDTARIRVLSAFHHAQIFKSDLQGKSDSAFYSNSDSTIHMFVNPIIWTQGSQLTGDTITLQMKNKKLDNMELFPNAFMVNVEKTDSTHFNQIAGKKMRGFFKDDKLETLFVDGNAETIYFSRDSGKVTGMQRSLSSRIIIHMKKGQVGALTFSGKPEHRHGPLEKFTEEDKVLKGFIWKPKERPVSKESIIHPVIIAPVKTTKDKSPPGTVTKGLPGKTPGVKTGKDSTITKPGSPQLQPLKPAGKDTTLTKPVPGTIKIDSTLKAPAVKQKDTTATSKSTGRPVI